MAEARVRMACVSLFRLRVLSSVKSCSQWPCPVSRPQGVQECDQACDRAPSRGSDPMTCLPKQLWACIYASSLQHLRGFRFSPGRQQGAHLVCCFAEPRYNSRVDRCSVRTGPPNCGPGPPGDARFHFPSGLAAPNGTPRG